MKKVDIFGTGIEAISPTITAQRRVNCYYDIRPDGENNQVVIIQSPGLTRYVTLPYAPIRGMWQNGLYAYVVAGYGLFLIQNSGYTFLGNFGSSNNPTTFVSMRTNYTQLLIADGINLYIFPISNIASLISSKGQILSELAPLQTIVNAL